MAPRRRGLRDRHPRRERAVSLDPDDRHACRGTIPLQLDVVTWREFGAGDGQAGTGDERPRRAQAGSDGPGRDERQEKGRQDEDDRDSGDPVPEARPSAVVTAAWG